MPLGTKWLVEFETVDPIGDIFIEGIILDGIGLKEDCKTRIAKNIHVKCLKELTNEEYKTYDMEIERLKTENSLLYFMLGKDRKGIH